MKRNDIPRGGYYWERAMYQSDAFLSLSKNAMKLLIALMDARMRDKSGNNARKPGKRSKVRFTNLDRIQMPYSVLRETYSMNDDGIARAKDELLAKGFISLTREGGTGQHDTALFALIDDYQHWTKGIVFRTRRRDVRRGYQGKRLGASAPENETRSGNLRLTHAAKPETKSQVSLRKPETKKKRNDEYN